MGVSSLLSSGFLGAELLGVTISFVPRVLRHCFPVRLYHFTFPRAKCGGSTHFTFLSALEAVCLFSQSHSMGWGVFLIANDSSVYTRLSVIRVLSLLGCLSVQVVKSSTLSIEYEFLCVLDISPSSDT